MSNNTGSVKTAEGYLQTKYQGAFTHVSHKEDVWSSKTNTELYEDGDGNRFCVRENDGTFSDNYGSVRFDNRAGQALQQVLGDGFRVYIRTESVFFGRTRSFTDMTAYLQACPVVNAAVYTDGQLEYPRIAEAVRQFAGSGKYLVAVYRVPETDRITGYADTASAVDSATFWVENGRITSASWEDGQ